MVWVCMAMCTAWHAIGTLEALSQDLDRTLTAWHVHTIDACEHAAQALEAWRAWPPVLVESVIRASTAAAESGVHSVGRIVISMYVDTSYIGWA